MKTKVKKRSIEFTRVEYQLQEDYKLNHKYHNKLYAKNNNNLTTCGMTK